MSYYEGWQIGAHKMIPCADAPGKILLSYETLTVVPDLTATCNKAVPRLRTMVRDRCCYQCQHDSTSQCTCQTETNHAFLRAASSAACNKLCQHATGIETAANKSATSAWLPCMSCHYLAQPDCVSEGCWLVNKQSQHGEDVSNEVKVL